MVLFCLQEAALTSLKSLNKTDVVEVRNNGLIFFFEEAMFKIGKLDKVGNHHACLQVTCNLKLAPWVHSRNVIVVIGTYPITSLRAKLHRVSWHFNSGTFCSMAFIQITARKDFVNRHTDFTTGK